MSIKEIIADIRRDWLMIIWQAVVLVAFVASVSGYMTDFIFWLITEVAA